MADGLFLLFGACATKHSQHLILIRELKGESHFFLDSKATGWIINAIFNKGFTFFKLLFK